jgi:serine/threonine protein phosphatase PrpC
VFTFVLIWRKKRDDKAMKKTITEHPELLPELELANLQGIGNREEQQDAFGISHMDRYEEDGLLAVLCDGMGGMAEGGMIAAETVSELVGIFPWADDSDIPGWISQRSTRVYQQFRGHGGTTLVAVLLKGNRLSFWCVGDSDLFLLREGKLYGMNIRQEYKNDLVLRALDGAFPVEEAFHDSQAGALSEYIGKEEVNCDYNRIPFSLQPEDVLLLCSDGISDTLTLKQIREAMALSPQVCCDKLEKEILSADKPSQDNYTTIVLNYHGKGEKE